MCGSVLLHHQSYLVFSQVLTLHYQHLFLLYFLSINHCFARASTGFSSSLTCSGTYLTETLLTQCLSLVGVNDSPSNTCPKCPSQFAHRISTRFIPKEVSTCVRTAPE
jgi:hypothetical protein